MKIKIHKTKKEAYFSRLKAIGLFSTSTAGRLAHEMFYQSGLRRLREDAEKLCGNTFRAIPDEEAKERRLVKKGNAVLRWYELA